MQPGQNCDQDMELFSPGWVGVSIGRSSQVSQLPRLTAEVDANGSKADFEVQAPYFAGYFSMCWTRGLFVPDCRFVAVMLLCRRQCFHGFYEAGQRLCQRAVSSACGLCPAVMSLMSFAGNVRSRCQGQETAS